MVQASGTYNSERGLRAFDDEMRYLKHGVRELLGGSQGGCGFAMMVSDEAPLEYFQL